MLSDFVARLLKIPTCSTMAVRDARNIVAMFGELVGELNDPKRFSLSDVKNKRTFSLPTARLGCSKEQVQTALAVAIAELVLNEGGFYSPDTRYVLHCQTFSSGDLAYLTDTPAEFSTHRELRLSSQAVFEDWQLHCEQWWQEISRTTRNRARSDEGLRKYWQQVDARIPELLASATLIAIRQT